LEVLHRVVVINKLFQLHILEWLCYYETKSMLARQSGVLSLLTLAFPIQYPHYKFTMAIVVVPHLGNIVVPFHI
jgi:hypothetical protein